MTPSNSIKSVRLSSPFRLPLSYSYLSSTLTVVIIAISLLGAYVFRNKKSILCGVTVSYQHGDVGQTA